MTRTLHAAAAAALLSALAACGTSSPDMPAPMGASTDMDAAAPALDSRAPAHAPIIQGQPVRVVGHPDQLALLASVDPELEANKRVAFDLWRSVLNAGHIEVADELMAEDYIQHSPVAGTGRAAFKEFFSSIMPRQPQIPETIQSEVVSIVAEDDYVVFAFARELDDPTAPGETYTTTWFDMFRIEDGRLAEHWDIATLPPGMPLIPASQGGPVPVTGATGEAQLPLLESDDPVLERNKRMVFDVWRGLVDARDTDYALEYLAEDYIQHNPNAATGREGVIAYFSSQPTQPVADTIEWPVVEVVAEGDLVVIAFVRELPVPGTENETYTTTWFDMFRIEDGRIAEHWDIATKAAPPGM